MLCYQTDAVFKVFSSRVLIHIDKRVKISKKDISLCLWPLLFGYTVAYITTVLFSQLQKQQMEADVDRVICQLASADL